MPELTGASLALSKVTGALAEHRDREEGMIERRDKAMLDAQAAGVPMRDIAYLARMTQTNAATRIRIAQEASK